MAKTSPAAHSAPQWYAAEELDAMMRGLIPAINGPIKTTDPAPKRPYIDCFGIPKAGKTTTTLDLDRLLRRYGLRVDIPSESAEYGIIRSKAHEPFAFQLQHVNIVYEQLLRGAWTRNHNVTITSRGLIDMLMWFRDGAGTGLYTAEQETGVRQMIYQMLRMDAVDAFLYFYCRPEVAMEREYGNSVASVTGSSKMNLPFLERVSGVYEEVLADLAREVPGLPIVRIDTSDLDCVTETTRAVLFHLMPLLIRRFKVSRGSVLPYSAQLMQREAFAAVRFEEQLKLKGHPLPERIRAAGFLPLDAVEQTDTYYDIESAGVSGDHRFTTVVRIRAENGKLLWQYKSEARDSVFSHRRPVQVEIGKDDADAIREKYPQIAAIVKSRMRYRLDREPSKSEGHFFTLHVDSTSVGEFTEIRARGSSERTHEEELLSLATELGFAPDDIVRGSYLGLISQE